MNDDTMKTTVIKVREKPQTEVNKWIMKMSMFLGGLEVENTDRLLKEADEDFYFELGSEMAKRTKALKSRIAELEKQVEEMRNCENCEHAGESTGNWPCLTCGPFKNWIPRTNRPKEG